MAAISAVPVRVEQLSYAYPQHGLGLATTDFRAEPGELWSVTGRSGCGKSTLARCLAGVIPHLYRGRMEGRVLIGEMDTRHTPLWQLCERVGLLFQNPAAQSLASTVEEEVLFGLENAGLSRDEMSRRLRESLERFDLAALAGRAPQTLSGGEMQRLLLAAVLARRPGVLVLDEPLSMLDTTAATELVAHLAELSRDGMTVIACEHRADYLRALPGMREHRLPSAKQATEPLADLSPAPLPSAGDVILNDVGLGFEGRRLFDGLNLTFLGGQVVALVGRNGVGKTTLLRAMMGLQPHTGQVYAEGGARPGFGLVFQNPDWQLFNPTVREELRYHVAQPDEALYAWLLEALSLTEYEQIPPLLLSEGEKKRLALGMLLLQEPRHGVLLDEPTLGQDDAHRAILGRVARGLAQAGKVVIAASHDLLWVAHYADRLILLAPGEVVADGPTHVVLRDRSAWERAGLIVPPWVLGEIAA
ncbi:MAG: ATP-binding cassette domain-containing protein [Chloroflexi bacterium]|nr:ATP-binding cassette domain-containing protein [Chloroflexota bacterium]